MPAAIVEDDGVVLDALDKRLALEQFSVAALRFESPCVTQRHPDVSDHEETAWSGRGAQFVQRVVRVLDVGAVEHQKDDEQSLERPRSDKRVLLPRPRAPI